MNQTRRTFLKRGAAGGLALTASSSLSASESLQPTPKEIKGPFYPVTPQKDKDFDLTKVDGLKEEAKGKHIVIEGQVVDETGAPVEDATVDLWQANHFGRYRHPHDRSDSPLDPAFQGWAIVPSGEKGEFRFKTVFPGTYPASEGWTRPPHIHFKVSKRGYEELVTQMYFEGHELNEKDLLIKRKTKAEQAQMIATLKKQDPPTYRYRIVLQKV